MGFIAGEKGRPFGHVALWAQVEVARELAEEHEADFREYVIASAMSDRQTIEAARSFVESGFTRQGLERFRTCVNNLVAEVAVRRRR